MGSFAIIAAICAATFGTTSEPWLPAVPIGAPIQGNQRLLWVAKYGTQTCAVEYQIKRTWVDVKATGYDERTYGNGCSPDGCVPYNTRDGSKSANSRWSCQGDILDSSDQDEGCCITYYFEEPQDIEKIQIAFHQGTSRTRTLDVLDNDYYHSTISSSGSTNGFQTYDLYTDETEELKLCLYDPKWNTDVWLSITEVKILVK